MDGEYDVIIIGGGITGAAAARALTQQGYRILLLEKNDFASGSTAASTKINSGVGLDPGVFYLGPRSSFP